MAPGNTAEEQENSPSEAEGATRRSGGLLSSAPQGLAFLLGQSEGCSRPRPPPPPPRDIWGSVKSQSVVGEKEEEEEGRPAELVPLLD